MKILFHTSKAIFLVDTDTITNAELENKFNMTRKNLDDFIEESKDTDIEQLKSRVDALEQSSRTD